jgi:hypothetical protein
MRYYLNAAILSMSHPLTVEVLLFLVPNVFEILIMFF